MSPALGWAPGPAGCGSVLLPEDSPGTGHGQTRVSVREGVRLPRAEMEATTFHSSPGKASTQECLVVGWGPDGITRHPREALTDGLPRDVWDLRSCASHLQMSGPPSPHAAQKENGASPPRNNLLQHCQPEEVGG